MVRLTSSIRIAGLTIALMASSSMTVSAQSAAQDYQNVLQQIADQKVQIMKSEFFVTQQGEEIDRLRQEISSVGPRNADVEGIILEMATKLEAAIISDVPFLREERLNRVRKIKADLDADNVPVGAVYRSALQALKIEVEYGQSVESYEALRPLNNGENPILVDERDKDGELVKTSEGIVQQVPEFGSHIRFGRVGLAYLSDDMNSARRFDTQSREWVDVSGAGLMDIRRSVRISKGEVAPGVVNVPTYIEGTTN